jgi:prolipoprotein diacylglyceryltransferase
VYNIKNSDVKKYKNGRVIGKKEEETMPIPNPVAFTIFGIDIMWYGIIIAAAMVLAVIIIYNRAPIHDISSEKTLDFVLICIPLGVVGARLYYVIFEWNDYAGDFTRSSISEAAALRSTAV